MRQGSAKENARHPAVLFTADLSDASKKPMTMGVAPLT